MTNTTTDPSTTRPSTSGPSTSGPPADDPRPTFDAVVATAGATIDGVGADQFGDPTPCDAYDVRTLISHMIGAMQRVAGVARGQDMSSVPAYATGIADSDLRDEWATTVADAHDAWSDPAVLGRDLVLPWVTLPGSIALRTYVFEFLTHTWDLARATDQSPDFDDAIVVPTLDAIQARLPPDGRDAVDVPFGPVGSVADDAPAIDRLAAWAGRQP